MVAFLSGDYKRWKQRKNVTIHVPRVDPEYAKAWAVGMTRAVRVLGQEAVDRFLAESTGKDYVVDPDDLQALADAYEALQNSPNGDVK